MASSETGVSKSATERDFIISEGTHDVPDIKCHVSHDDTGENHGKSPSARGEENDLPINCGGFRIPKRKRGESHGNDNACGRSQPAVALSEVSQPYKLFKLGLQQSEGVGVASRHERIC